MMSLVFSPRAQTLRIPLKSSTGALPKDGTQILFTASRHGVAFANPPHMPIRSVLLTAVLLCSTGGFAQDADAPLTPDQLKTSLASIQAVMKEMKPYEGSGPVYAAQIALGFEPSLPDDRPWMIRLSDAERRVVISDARLSRSLTAREWTSIFAVIYESAYTGPFRALERQELQKELQDPLRRSEAAGLDANFLNRLRSHLLHGDSDIARFLGGSLRGEKSTQLLGAYVLSMAAAFHIDISGISPQNGGDQKGASELRQVMERISKLLGEEIEERKQASELFKAAQDRPLHRRGTSLHDLMARLQANDREAVARILESDLPWEKFTGAELRHHRRWIEAIRHPSLEKSVYVLRGTNPARDPQPERQGLLSKLLKTGLKNNMTVTELFEGYRKEWISQTTNRKTDLPFPQFGNLAENHSFSSNETATLPSSYISTTTSAPVISKFSKGSNIMIRIDARRVQPNYETMMAYEREVLLPLLVFPDEIMGLVETDADKKRVVRREADSSVNQEATDFFKSHMAKDEKAGDDLFDLWRKTTADFFPTARGVQTVSGPAGAAFLKAPATAEPLSCSRIF